MPSGTFIGINLECINTEDTRAGCGRVMVAKFLFLPATCLLIPPSPLSLSLFVPPIPPSLSPFVRTFRVFFFCALSLFPPFLSPSISFPLSYPENRPSPTLPFHPPSVLMIVTFIPLSIRPFIGKFERNGRVTDIFLVWPKAVFRMHKERLSLADSKAPPAANGLFGNNECICFTLRWLGCHMQMQWRCKKIFIGIVKCFYFLFFFYTAVCFVLFIQKVDYLFILSLESHLLQILLHFFFLCRFRSISLCKISSVFLFLYNEQTTIS